MESRHSARGISLIESCAALAIVAVLAATAAPSYKEAQIRKTVEGAAAELAAQIHYARTAAQARSDTVRMSLYTDAAGSCVLVHTGAAAECQCHGGEPAECSGTATLLRRLALDASTGVQLQSNSTSMLFDPLHGTTTPAGTWRVVSTTAGSVHHVVNILGRVRTCSPVPALSGFRTC